jgi:hypothetical protein
VLCLSDCNDESDLDEGFIESSHESMRVAAEYTSERLETEEIDANTGSIPDPLEMSGKNLNRVSPGSLRAAGAA